MLPCRPAAFISAASASTPAKLVPVDPPQRRPSSRSSSPSAARLTPSGTLYIRSTISGRNEASTRGRPIPSGQVSPEQALGFVVGLSLVGLVVLLQFNRFTIWLAIASLALVAVYPFMKRITNWPQAVLGLAFNWGALVGWSATTGSLAWPAVLLYVGSVLWTIGYDTIYAHQDKEDDALIGVRSTALKLGAATPKWLAGFYAGAILLWGTAAVLAGGRGIALVALAIAAAHLAWQIATLDTSDAGNCLKRFRSNREVGLILFAGLVVEMAIA